MTKLPSVTVAQVLAWRPCPPYTRERIRELFGRKRRFTCDDFARLEIPIQDKLWCILHRELIPDKELTLLACRYAKRTLGYECKAGREPDERSWNAIRVARRFIAGEVSQAELASAWAAAWAAARGAAWAARAAKGAAAEAAAGASAYAAEIRWQFRAALKVARKTI